MKLKLQWNAKDFWLLIKLRDIILNNIKVISTLVATSLCRSLCQIIPTVEENLFWLLVYLWRIYLFLEGDIGRSKWKPMWSLKKVLTEKLQCYVFGIMQAQHLLQNKVVKEMQHKNSPIIINSFFKLHCIQ